MASPQLLPTFSKTKSAMKLVTRPVPIKTKSWSEKSVSWISEGTVTNESIIRTLIPKTVSYQSKNQFLNIAICVINEVIKDIGVARDMASPDWWRWSRFACFRAQSVLIRDCAGSRL